MPNTTLLAILIVAPIVAGVGALAVKSEALRRWLVGALALTLIGAVALVYKRVPFTIDMSTVGGVSWDELVAIADLLLAGYAIWIGWRLRDRIIIAMAAAQAAIMVAFDLFVRPEASGPAFVVDWLALIIALLVAVVGSLIAIYALGYMREHEHHQHVARSRQPRFFAILLAFLGVMNALVFANRLPWLYLAWECTTLASFLLISHDGTPEALASGARALRINLFGGFAIACGIVLAHYSFGTLSLAEITSSPVVGSVGLVALGLFTLAGFTKAAQLPFQSWLLGAMVAPTPVSALLHSSTMVKAGVYFVLRLAPAFRGTTFSLVVSLLGAFTFLATSALAFSQSNAKKVLAYSTIANLGLIIACAGVNTPLAVGAALALIFFHGLSKALLFLCVGAIEQNIGSRDIEDMEGLIDRMPITTIISVVGIISVLLPPFGVLISKWAMMEAAARSPVTVILFAIGSALTLGFWTKWMARMVASGYAERLVPERLSGSIRFTLVTLAGLVLVSSLGITAVMNHLVGPAEATFYGTALLGGRGDVATMVGNFPIWPALSGLIVMCIAMPVVYTRSKHTPVVPPYLCGENVQSDSGSFRSAEDQPRAAIEGGFYLQSVFGEQAIGKAVNIIAVVGLIILFGVMI